jgi:hypothetical protein
MNWQHEHLFVTDTYLFSALVFSFSSHALIKEFLFSVSTLARATSTFQILGCKVGIVVLAVHEKKGN